MQDGSKKFGPFLRTITFTLYSKSNDAGMTYSLFGETLYL